MEKKLTKKELNYIWKNNFGWGDFKRKVCSAMGVEYQWGYELPKYIMDFVGTKHMY